jgi:hypothetical protein
MESVYSGLANLGEWSSSFWLVIGLGLSTLLTIASIYVAFFRSSAKEDEDRSKTAIILFVFAALVALGTGLNYYLNHRYKFYAAASGSTSIVDLLRKL